MKWLWVFAFLAFNGARLEAHPGSGLVVTDRVSCFAGGSERDLADTVAADVRRL